MRFLEPTFALLALPTTILAVSLSDFTPRASNLPSSCETVYTSQISGCSPSDFASPSCSKGCIEALNSFTSKVQSACGNKGIKGSNIITTFLEGKGPGGLCTNADAVLGGGSASTSAASTNAASTSAAATTKTSTSSTLSSSSASSTSSAETSSSAPASSSSAVLSGTATATSLASSSSATHSTSGILLDTSSVSSPTPTSSSSGNPQTNLNDNSGGGSPFDTEGNMNSLAAGSSCSLATVLSMAAMVLFATLR